ncbi:MAG: EI24 domain-containing protein [Planctomycetes bacterium]|nr:EI24 domain-containing protein [Planctomycetota bacterium]
MKSVLAGFGDFIAGFGLIVRVPSIRKWAVIPMLLNAALFGLMAVLVFLYAGDVVHWMVGQAHSTWGKAGFFMLQLLIILVGLVVVVFLSLVLSSVVAAPFYTKLAEATLRHLTGREIATSGPLWKIAFVTIGQELVKLFIFVGIQAVLIGIGFIPIVGQIAAAGVTMLLLAFEFADYSLEAYGHRVFDRYRFIVKNSGSSIGFGGGAFLVTLIPLMGIVTAPAAVAGAARMVVRLKGDNVR